MNEAKVSALLGRPLTSIETTNFNLYLNIAKRTLGSLVCTSLCDQSDPKIYDIREGYRTVFMDAFISVDEVKVDGEVVDLSDYSPRLWDKRNAPWFNSLVFDKRFTECDHEIEVSATWGFDSKMPSDLQLVVASLFDLITKKNRLDVSVQSKKVEDFQITFRADVDLDESFRQRYADTISKYSLCSVLNMQHGKVC